MPNATPFCALQGVLEMCLVVAISEIDTFASSTGNFNIPSQVLIGRYGKGCASALSGSGARMLFAQSDLFYALQACFESGPFETVMSEIDIFASSTGNFNHFGPHEDDKEQRSRWKHRTL